MSEARSGLSTQLEAFAANTMEYMKRERGLLLDGVGVPDSRPGSRAGTPSIVVRGYDHKRGPAGLRPYIRDHRPVLIGVDAGADALLRGRGTCPDLVVGDMDSVTDAALTSGAEVVVHAYPDGARPRAAARQELGVPAITFPAAATSEDIALLLADEKGAQLIVAVGTHATLVEFLDKGRGGMASTFLTRLRLGGKLVDANGVSRLYRSRISTAALLVLVLAALVAIGAAVAVSAAGRVYLAPAGRPVAQLRVLAGEPRLVIDFRYHLVSLIAVFLAVALGIVIGTTAAQPADPQRHPQGQVSTLAAGQADVEDRTRQLGRAGGGRRAVRRGRRPRAGRPARSPGAGCCSCSPPTPLPRRGRPADHPGRARRGHGLRHAPAAAGLHRPAAASRIQSYVTGPGLPAGLALPETDDSAQLVATLLAGVLMLPHGPGRAAPPARPASARSARCSPGCRPSTSSRRRAPRWPRPTTPSS